MTRVDAVASGAVPSRSAEDLPLRLFVALPVPPDVRAEIGSAVAAVSEPGTLDRLRWVRPEAWHLTLTFCGSVPPERVDQLRVRLGRAAAHSRPLKLSVTGAGRFGQQVLWAGVVGDREPLCRLSRSTGAAARRCGIAVTDRPYRPHLTLARGGTGVDLQQVVAQLAGLQASPWTAEELLLFRSRLGVGAGGTAQHEVVGRWSLGASLACGDGSTHAPAVDPGGPAPAPRGGRDRRDTSLT